VGRPILSSPLCFVSLVVQFSIVRVKVAVVIVRPLVCCVCVRLVSDGRSIISLSEIARAVLNNFRK